MASLNLAGLIEGVGMALLGAPSWGICDQYGNPVIGPDSGLVGIALSELGIGPTISTGEFGFSKDLPIIDAPIEKGSFVSFNKVGLPSVSRVTLYVGGSESDRADCLATMVVIADSTDLYSVVTPEIVISNVSIQRYRYHRRHDKGLNLLIIEIEVKEVREVSSQYSKVPINSPKDPSASAPSNNGTVQPQPPDQSVLSKILG